ncbi:hypothetical protein ACFSQT_31965 [Mesorhizobium calcicola]|uniref:Transposase n=1 Tax=Mesorhizobium calcicola TaxID=1300310 RepID=A0ABW4WM85_9HYPH
MSTKKDSSAASWPGAKRWSAPDRQVVVGIKPTDKARRLRSGAHIIRIRAEHQRRATTKGYVTSVCFSSDNHDQWLGLGLVTNAGASRASARSSHAHDPLRRADGLTTTSNCAIPSSTIG